MALSIEGPRTLVLYITPPGIDRAPNESVLNRDTEDLTNPDGNQDLISLFGEPL